MGFAVETSADMTVERPSIIRHLYTLLSDKELVKDEALRGALFEKVGSARSLRVSRLALTVATAIRSCSSSRTCA